MAMMMFSDKGLDASLEYIANTYMGTGHGVPLFSLQVPAYLSHACYNDVMSATRL